MILESKMHLIALETVLSYVQKKLLKRDVAYNCDDKRLVINALILVNWGIKC